MFTVTFPLDIGTEEDRNGPHKKFYCFEIKE